MPTPELVAATVAAAHTCACEACDPSLKPSKKPVSKGHFAVQFGHHRPAMRLSVTLNGEPVTHVAESVVGEHGWVRRYRENAEGRRHICQRCYGNDGPGACAERLEGAVVVTVS